MIIRVLHTFILNGKIFHIHTFTFYTNLYLFKLNHSNYWIFNALQILKLIFLKITNKWLIHCAKKSKISTISTFSAFILYPRLSSTNISATASPNYRNFAQKLLMVASCKLQVAESKETCNSNSFGSSTIRMKNLNLGFPSSVFSMKVYLSLTIILLSSNWQKCFLKSSCGWSSNPFEFSSHLVADEESQKVRKRRDRCLWETFNTLNNNDNVCASTAIIFPPRRAIA